MRISVYSLSLQDKSPSEVVELASRYGCDGIEWWCREGGHLDAVDPESSAREILGIMKGSGIAVAGISPYFKYSESRDDIRPVFHAAAILDSPNIRCHSYKFTGEESVALLLQKQRKWMEEVVLPVAQEFKVRMVIEQHHTHICCTPNACRQLVEGLPPESVGIIYDPGNALFEGYTTPEYAMDVFGEYLAHVHVKSAKPITEGDNIPRGRKYPIHWGALQEGDLDWEKIIRVLHKSGYEGYLSLEALDERESEQKLREDILYLRSLVDLVDNG